MTRPQRNGATLVAVSDAVAGSGTKIVTAVLASMLTHASFEDGTAPRVCLVEVGHGFATGDFIGQYLPNTTDLVLSDAPLSDDVLRSHLIYSEKLGFHSLLGAVSIGQAGITTPEFYREVLERLKPMFDFIILRASSSPAQSAYRELVMEVCDYFLMVSGAEDKPLLFTCETLGEMFPDDSDTDCLTPDRVGFMLTRSNHGDMASAEYLMKRYAPGVEVLGNLNRGTLDVITRYDYDLGFVVVSENLSQDHGFYNVCARIAGLRGGVLT